MYEFAPGAHAGPYGHGDPFLTFRAARTSREFDASIALQSALWLHGLSDRAPNKHELAAAPGAAVPDAVTREMRVVRFHAQLEPTLIDGLPVHHAASVLVHLAAKPSAIRNWPVFAESLPELVALATSTNEVLQSAERSGTRRLAEHPNRRRGDEDELERLRVELAGRSRATTVRLAYLLSAVAPEIANQLQPQPATGVVYFGPRQPSRRFSARFNVADTLLPFDPADLQSLGTSR
jgi:hypothetical protein